MRKVKKKDSDYEFKQALKDASERKSEMGHTEAISGGKKHHKRNRTAKRNKSASASKKS